MQLVAEGHETPRSRACAPSLGVTWTVQAVAAVAGPAADTAQAAAVIKTMMRLRMIFSFLSDLSGN
jgi:hypothetical protein